MNFLFGIKRKSEANKGKMIPMLKTAKLSG